jgi:hypothetical protein
MSVGLTDLQLEHRAEKYQRGLQNLQGNILKGHGRDYTVHIRYSTSPSHHNPHLSRACPAGEKTIFAGPPPSHGSIKTLDRGQISPQNVWDSCL